VPVSGVALMILASLMFRLRSNVQPPAFLREIVAVAPTGIVIAVPLGGFSIEARDAPAVIATAAARAKPRERRSERVELMAMR
jgi:hypothetical protein